MRIVAALGGNAILHRGERGTVGEQRTAVRDACAGLAALAAAGHDLVVTHGNGPQVGRLMLLNRAHGHRVPPMPLDVLVAETQGQVGYLLAQELDAALARVGSSRPVVTVLTQVIVDPADPAFLRPTKPVGPHLAAEEAQELRASGVAVGREADESWRRLVPSPAPRALVEEAALSALVAAEIVPVAAGGGGVPVVREGNALRGVEAVVDKDLTAALLVRVVAAELLLILTDVSQVSLGYGTAAERPVGRLSAVEARTALDAGEFAPGSMGPKIEACLAAHDAGARAVVASLESAVDAVDGRAGTEVG